MKSRFNGNSVFMVCLVWNIIRYFRQHIPITIIVWLLILKSFFLEFRFQIFFLFTFKNKSPPSDLLSWYKLHGTFNKFPDFFVHTFKIIVDTWKFTMLLLSILWDDWPIFMISASNKQLQQELEYTQLKPDCHSWWI